jgi:hypothetical protein
VRGGQATAYTDAMLDKLANDVAHVPALLPLEFSNVVRKVLTGKKITEERAREIMQTQAVPAPAKVGAGETAIFRCDEAAGFTQRSDVPESFTGTYPFRLIPHWIHVPRSDSNPIGQC